MNDEREKVKRQIENIDFYIWLFGRYNGKTAKEIVCAYEERKNDLTKRYTELSKESKGADKGDGF